MKKLLLSTMGLILANVSIGAPINNLNENLNDYSNSRYGWLKIVNDSPDVVTIKRVDQLSSHAVFVEGLVDGRFSLQPKESKWLYYQTDWGVHYATTIDANARCQLDASGEFSAYSLIIGGVVRGKFSTEASCSAALRAEGSFYTGIFPVTTAYLDVSSKNSVGCRSEGGSISINHETTSVLAVKATGAKRLYDGEKTCTWGVPSIRYSFINDKPEPAMFNIQAPYSEVHITTDVQVKDTISGAGRNFW